MLSLIENKPRAEAIKKYMQAGHWIETTTNEVLEKNAREFPDRVALVDGRIRLTYGELYRRVQRLAAHWHHLGLTRADVIALQLPNWSEFVVAVNAAMMLGIPFCQFHSGFRRKEIEFVLRFLGATVVISPKEFRGFDHLGLIRELQATLPRLKHLHVVDDAMHAGAFGLRQFLDTDAEPVAAEDELRALRPTGNDIARVLFTSGTTGDPKAVMHTHNTLQCACSFNNRDYGIGEDSSMLIFLPVGLNWGFFCTVQTILAGGKIVLMESFDPENALRLIEAERVTHFGTAPTALIGMLEVSRLKEFDLHSLKAVTTSGTACPVSLIRRWREKVPGHLVELYGMCESGVQSCTFMTDDPEQVSGTVGRPAKEVEMRIVDGNGHDVAPGEIGEILARGPSVTIGYFNNPVMNAELFTPDAWFRTGDLGRLDDRGYLVIVGRRKEMIIRGGANVYPREIEEVLFRHPKILDAAVVGVPDERVGERACACIIPRPGETLDFDEVVRFLAGEIATYKVPERVEIMGDFPRTPSGKVQKGVLREMILAMR